MWPIMFATSLHPDMNAIPAFPGKCVDWIPVDVAAGTITDSLTCADEGTQYEVHNIVNPRRIKWEELVGMLQDIASSGEQSKKMEVVSMKEWVEKLNGLADAGVSPDEVPGLKLLQFFEGMLGDGEEEERVFETGKTEGVSGALAGCQAFNGGWVEKNVEIWREGGFLK